MKDTTKTPHEEVTFQFRGRTARIHKARFECGENNGILILRHAWNHNSKIIGIRKYEAAA